MKRVECGEVSVEVKVQFNLFESTSRNRKPMAIHLTIPSMACAACAETITKAIRSVDAMAQVVADPKTKQVEIETLQTEDSIRAAIAASGYPVQ
jgi:copper chaperone